MGWLGPGAPSGGSSIGPWDAGQRPHRPRPSGPSQGAGDSIGSTPGQSPSRRRKTGFKQQSQERPKGGHRRQVSQMSRALNQGGPAKPLQVAATSLPDAGQSADRAGNTTPAGMGLERPSLDATFLAAIHGERHDDHTKFRDPDSTALDVRSRLSGSAPMCRWVESVVRSVGKPSKRLPSHCGRVRCDRSDQPGLIPQAPLAALTRAAWPRLGETGALKRGACPRPARPCGAAQRPSPETGNSPHAGELSHLASMHKPGHRCRGWIAKHALAIDTFL